MNCLTNICWRMNKLEFRIRGFKCFFDSTFELNKITLLTGANASGKSSVIQALLLLNAASEAEESSYLINLANRQMAFDFGQPDSLVNNEWLKDEVMITMSDGCILGFNSMNQDSNRILKVRVDNLSRLKDAFEKGLIYLCAERQGPRYEYKRQMGEEHGCGCYGENTGNVISDSWNVKIKGDRMNRMVNDSLFSIALDEWVDYIFPGISVRIQQVGSQNYQVIVRDGNHNVTTNSTNVGFGISYALPILVEGLLAKDGSWFVVENPEAHIHAKAQSNIGYFLGTMAAAGLRVIVETHSEHIVNGIRRAAIVGGRLTPEDVNIYFFNGKSKSELLAIDKYGNLSDFPVDFFDQSRQDMFEIIKWQRSAK